MNALFGDLFLGGDTTEFMRPTWEPTGNPFTTTEMNYGNQSNTAAGRNEGNGSNRGKRRGIPPEDAERLLKSFKYIPMPRSVTRGLRDTILDKLIDKMYDDQQRYDRYDELEREMNRQ